jgi:hypothetical protein
VELTSSVIILLYFTRGGDGGHGDLMTTAERARWRVGVQPASQPRKKRTKAAREGGALCRGLCDMPTSPRAQQRQQGRSMGRRGRVSIVLCTVDRFPSLQYSPPSLKHALQMQTAIQRGAFITVIGLGLCTDLSYVLINQNRDVFPLNFLARLFRLGDLYLSFSMGIYFR